MRIGMKKSIPYIIAELGLNTNLVIRIL